MDIVYVDIYDLYFDDDLCPKKTKHRFAGAYRANNFNRYKFENDFKYTIMMDKNDGIDLEIVSINNIHYVNLFLHLTEGTDYDIGYIINFLDKKLSKINDELLVNNESNTYRNYLYIKCIDKPELDKIISELDENGVTVQRVGYTSSHFEHGCGNWWDAYLLGLVTNWSSSAIERSIMKLVKKYKNNPDEEHVVLEHIQIEDKIIDYLCNYAKAEKEELYLYSLESNGDKKVMQWRTRYHIFDVVASESKIISLKTYPIAETYIVKDEIEQSN